MTLAVKGALNPDATNTTKHVCSLSMLVITSTCSCIYTCTAYEKLKFMSYHSEYTGAILYPALFLLNNLLFVWCFNYLAGASTPIHAFLGLSHCLLPQITVVTVVEKMDGK